MCFEYCSNLLRVTRGARNPNLQVVITHASRVCGQQPALVWTSTKNEWNAQNAHWSRAFRLSTLVI